jgi:PAS domain S-box-containing protein
MGMVADTTERKQTEEALRQKEAELTEAQRLAGVGNWHWDSQKDKVIWSKELYRLLGRDPNSPAPSFKEHPGLYTAESWERLQGAVREALQTGAPYEFDMEILTPKSITKWVTARGETLRDPNGQIVGLRGTVQDITERKHADQALRESEARERARVKELEAILDAVPVPVLIAHDAECRHITGNRAASEQLREARGQNLSQSAPPGERPAFRQIKDGVEIAADLLPMQQAAATGRPMYRRELTLLYEDGTTREEIANAVPLLDEDGKPRGAVGASIDVTELKRTERALRESEDKLRLLLDSTAEAIYGVDLEHRCTFCNPASLRALGFKHVDEMLGKNMHQLIHHTRRDGTPFPIEECQVHRVTRTREGTHAEDEVLWRANGTSFPVEYWSYPQRRGHEVVGAVVTFIDITERKLAEAALANVSRKLIEAQEQERTRIGRELHDDIGQRLALLAVELQRLKGDPFVLPRHRSRLGGLQKKASEIAADTQSLSHELHSARLQYLGITAAMRGFCREFGEQQKVKVDFKANDLPGALSPDISLCLFRILQEALHNSAKHSGALRFEVHLWGTANDIHLDIKDSGKGFDREAARTSQGIGLISMEERLKIVNGTLSIESQPGHGTTIEARVPVSSERDSMRAAG